MRVDSEIGTDGFSRTKRADEQKRIALIHDAKTRSIGVDVPFLSSQVSGKAARIEDERSVDLAHSKMAEYFDQQICIKEQEMRELERALNYQLKDFRKENQTKEQRREWDLNDPTQLKNDRPARIGDDDERNGSSSMQQFDGEDLGAEDRKKLQMAQQEAWADQQVAEKAEAKARDAAEQAYVVDMMKRQLKVQCDVENENERLRAALDADITAKNGELVALKAEREQLLRDMIAEQDAAEQAITASSGIMTEDPRLGVSSFQPHRTRVDHWKGCSDADKQEVIDFQATQRKDLLARKEMEAAEERLYAYNQKQIRKALYIQDNQVEEFRKQQHMAVAETNKALEQTKVEKDEFMNTKVYTNVPDASFFSQFGTTSR